MPAGPRDHQLPAGRNGGSSCPAIATAALTSTAFGPISKRRRGFPSETCVGRGLRVVHGGKELLEKLGNEDPCPCGSGRRF
ncbi:MAG: nucleic acid-binding protein [Armatimonadetes bacterium]|jgi:hypothetical protein|nr:nucleic acid-binding protein [Armatimonadota bacterium]